MTQNRTAIVTGAASDAGLGYAAARLLAQDVMTVYITDIDGNAVMKRAEELSANGCKVVAAQQDVTDESAWNALISRVKEETGRIDALVNNAGIAVLRMMDDLTEESWDRQIDINMKSVYMGCRAVLPMMKAQESGSIVNLSSVAGMIGIPGCTAYSASKAGVRVMSKSIAMEVAAQNIRVNTVHPGMIWTDMQKVAIKDNPEQYDIITQGIPMKRMGKPDDIAQMVLFLVSDRSTYITGSEFVVDGGMTAQ
ncbi:SDR family NAD(P)-dependent oxidoreductase [Croceicoccus hydrothermalis]|uniref:SDR family NAD(P)-dependent oxidoreductase n=1 Tax=Croceicoccus hydrothermalis TaxID=2867964 RepID=UPI001EFC298F|nr:SDR family NAD(P)-dependent oxidoreductase [Croceicoccus hydrothermalis]